MKRTISFARLRRRMAWGSGSALASLAALVAIAFLHPAAAAPGDAVDIVYVNGIATNAAQAEGDRRALEQAVLGAGLRAQYPETLRVGVQHNPTAGFDADAQELRQLKTLEERWLPALWAAFQEGRDAPAVRDAAALNALHDIYLPQLPADIRGVVQALVNRWAPVLAADPTRKLVLVGHSQGNFVVQWAWLGLHRRLGATALAQARVVNVGTATRWSPFGLDVTLGEDRGVYNWGAGLGRDVPRDTPFCRSASAAQGCPFGLPPPTVDAGGLCNSAALRGGSATCHNFRSTYLSALNTETVATQRLAVSTALREGPLIRQRVVDAVYTALDSLDAATPEGWLADAFGGHFLHQASAPAANRLDLLAPAGGRAAAVGRASFDRGLQAQWRGCLLPPATGEAQVMFDLQPRDGVLSATPDFGGTPLWALGLRARAAAPQALQFVFGRGPAPRPGDGAQLVNVQPPRTAEGWCGQFTLGIGDDGHGQARFVSDVDGSVWSARSAAPVTAGVKRLHVAVPGPTPLSLQTLDVSPVPFATPFPAGLTR